MLIRHILAKKGTHVVTIQPEQTVRQAIALLAQYKIGALIVVDPSSKPVGIITERDIIRAASTKDDFFNQTVREVMTTNLIAGSLNDDSRSAEHTMTEKRFRHLPIMDQGKLAGIISIGDLVKAQMEDYQGEVESLKSYITR